MAQMRGLGFKKGNLGEINFRQQVVKVKNGYAKRTVASQKVITNSSNSVKQSKQRSKFRLIQQLATALSAKGILRNFYLTLTNLPAYQMFIKDHLTNDRAIHVSGGQNFLDFKKLWVTKGSKAKNIKAYAVSDGTNGMGQRFAENMCSCFMRLAWNYDYLVDGDGAQHVLQLVGIKIAEDGSIEEIIHHQPLATMNQCSVEVELPYCNCCKTYWYGFFVNPMDGTFTTSKYFGTCSCELPEFTEDNCLVCNDYVQLTVPDPATPPTDCPDGSCGENGNVNPADIVYNGVSQIYDNGNGDISLIIPTAPENGYDLPILAEIHKYQTYTLELREDFTLRTTDLGTTATIAITDTDAQIEAFISSVLSKTNVEAVSVSRNPDSSISLRIESPDLIDGFGVNAAADGSDINVLSASLAKVSFTSNTNVSIEVKDTADALLISGLYQVSMEIVVSGSVIDYAVMASDDNGSVTKNYQIAADGETIAEV